MTYDLIIQARRKFLATNPPRISDVQGYTRSGEPAGTMKIPNIGDIQIIGCKLGMEYLAICHDEEAVEEWIHAALGIVKDPELAGILFANVFRGVNLVIAGIIEQTPGLREQMHRLALQAWDKDFAEFGGEA